MKTCILAMDNGLGNASIFYPKDSGWITEVDFFYIPTKKFRNYTKKKSTITRIDVPKLIAKIHHLPLDTAVLLERPMLNPGRWKASISAARTMEAVLVALEHVGFTNIQYIDSKQWQHTLLPKGTEGPALKEASLYLGQKLYPQFITAFKKDADGLLIGHWYKTKHEL